MNTNVDFHVVLQQDEDGVYIAHVPLLPGCHTQGATQREALQHVQEAIEGYLELFGGPAGRFVGVRRVHVSA